ncbi:MAG TPA: MFS transporter, partial [Rhodocyclaceae bacterium]|nr:MFS transporter [Rhodocyclaceae bacterium]
MSAVAAGEPEAAIDVGRLLDGLAPGALQRRILFWSCLLMAVEGYDMQVAAYGAPAIIKAWGLDKPAFAVVFAAGLFGYLLGALVLGPVGDRLGRKKVVVGSTLLFGAATLLCALAASRAELLGLRLVTGVGLGGSVANIIALAAEYAPARRRGTTVALLFVGYTIGSALGGLLAAALL